MSVEYRSFLSNGSISPVDDPMKKRSRKILQDTEGTQSLVVKGFVPWGSNSATGEPIVQGVSSSFINIPLHRIHLMPELVSSPVKVGVVPSLPIKSIYMLGNELAGEG